MGSDPVTKANLVAVNSGRDGGLCDGGLLAGRRRQVLRGGSFTMMQVNRDSSCFERLYPLSL